MCRWPFASALHSHVSATVYLLALTPFRHCHCLLSTVSFCLLTPAVSAQGGYNPRKGQPVLVKPGQLAKPTWKPTPPQPCMHAYYFMLHPAVTPQCSLIVHLIITHHLPCAPGFPFMPAVSAQGGYNPRKGQPVLVKPGQLAKLTWKPTPPHPDVVMCCGGGLQLSWSPMEGGVVSSGAAAALVYVLFQKCMLNGDREAAGEGVLSWSPMEGGVVSSGAAVLF